VILPYPNFGRRVMFSHPASPNRRRMNGRRGLVAVACQRRADEQQPRGRLLQLLLRPPLPKLGFIFVFASIL
jgi:hypothetical protein